MAGEKAKCDEEAGRREALESVEGSNACAPPPLLPPPIFHHTHLLARCLCVTLGRRYLCDIIADIDGSGCGEHALVSYVKGVCLNKQGARRAAMAALVHSVQLFPLNWSAWMEILTKWYRHILQDRRHGKLLGFVPCSHPLRTLGGRGNEQN